MITLWCLFDMKNPIASGGFMRLKTSIYLAIRGHRVYILYNAYKRLTADIYWTL